MGCDIHCFVEYRERNHHPDDSWMWFGGRINPGRKYEVFGRLAGVRWNVPDALEPRGLPSDIAFPAREHAFLFIIDKETENESYVSRELAEQWIASGLCKKYGDHWITHPDWHSYSWVTPDEWEKATAGGGREYAALLAAMRSLESSGCEVRVVFWFDN